MTTAKPTILHHYYIYAFKKEDPEIQYILLPETERYSGLARWATKSTWKEVEPLDWTKAMLFQTVVDAGLELDAISESDDIPEGVSICIGRIRSEVDPFFPAIPVER